MTGNLFENIQSQVLRDALAHPVFEAHKEIVDRTMGDIRASQKYLLCCGVCLEVFYSVPSMNVTLSWGMHPVSHKFCFLIKVADADVLPFEEANLLLRMHLAEYIPALLYKISSELLRVAEEQQRTAG